MFPASPNGKGPGGLPKGWSRKMKRLSHWIGGHLPLLLAGWYFYGMLINSVRLGIDSTFRAPGSPEIKSIWVLNPIKNLLAVFTPTGLGVTFFCVVMVCLITKKGYHWLSGYKFERDPRGFDIVTEGTHGTGGWWTKRQEIEKLIDIGPPEQLEGILIGKQGETGEEEYLAMKPELPLNRHVMIYGASGTGKSRGFVLPFIYGMATKAKKESMVIVDPKGELFERTSETLRRQEYLVKAYNLLDLENSDGFNCMSVVGDDPSLIATIAEVIIKNTSNANERQDFWEKAEKNLLMALLHYVNNRCDPSTGELLPIEERSLGVVYSILSQNSFQEIDELFAQLPAGHPAISPYNVFKLAGRQIWGNVAIGLGNRLSVFQNPLIDKITRYDDIDLFQLGQRPCAYYCIISAQDSSLEFLSSMFFSLMFTVLPNYARKNCPGGRLPVAVNAMLEEACNIGHLVDFKRTIAVCRSFGINCQVVIQGVAQISDRYPDREWEEIIGNCDLQIFLGANDKMTVDYWSAKIGVASITTTTNQTPVQPLFSPVYNNTRPYSQSRTTTQRPLMYPDELLRLDNSREIVILRGQKPLLLSKINPDDLPGFREMPRVRVVDYIPQWRVREEGEKGKAKAVPTAPVEPIPPEPPPSTVEPVPLTDTSTETKPESPLTPPPEPAKTEPPQAVGLLRRYVHTAVTIDDMKRNSVHEE